MRRIGSVLSAILAAGLPALLATSANAGGLYTNEFSTTVQGSARAGAVAWAPDASIALFNPAGMTELGDHSVASGFSLGVANIHFDTDEANFGGGDGGEQGGLAPLASLNYVHKISERFRFGMTVFSLSGSILDPSSNWAGRFEITELSLLTLSFAPSLGIKVTDWLSIGGGPVITYGVLDWKLRVRLPNREGKIRLDELDDWEATGRVGAMLHPTDDLNIAVVYLGETEFDLGGDIEIAAGATAGIDVKLPLVETVEVGLHWQATDALALLATFNWENWSKFDNLPVSTARGSATVGTGWYDTYKLALGMAYDVSEKWMVQTGVSMDTSPVRNKDRIAALPVDRQIRGAVGTRYRLDNGIDLGLNFVYANLGKGYLRTVNVRGKYDENNLFIFGVTVGSNQLPWAGKLTL